MRRRRLESSAPSEWSFSRQGALGAFFHALSFHNWSQWRADRQTDIDDYTIQLVRPKGTKKLDNAYRSSFKLGYCETGRRGTNITSVFQYC